MSVFCVLPGGQANCLAALKQGNVLAISPGGVREAFFGQGYRLVWKDRVGFAKVAVEAKVVSELPSWSIYWFCASRRWEFTFCASYLLIWARDMG